MTSTYDDDVTKSPPLKIKIQVYCGEEIAMGPGKADLLDAFDARDPDISYFYASRLPGEPADGVEDRHIHPVEPRQFRFTARFAF